MFFCTKIIKIDGFGGYQSYSQLNSGAFFNETQQNATNLNISLSAATYFVLFCWKM